MNALASSDRPAARSGAVAPISQTPKIKLDRFGRNPDAPGELLRRQTNYDADSGYAPFYAAMLADLPRLSSGKVCTDFLLTVLVQSLGRPDNPRKGKRHEWTKALTVEYFAEVCRCHIRDIQRQLRDLSDRKVIEVETMARGTYKVALRYRDWQGLPDYQPARLVAIDEPEESAEDESAEVETSKDAVRLVKRPLKVNAGKTGRSIKVNVGIRALRWQNAATLPLVYDAVVQNGEMVISTRLASDWRGTVGETEANSQRHGCRDADSADPRSCHARAVDVIEVFDPLLQNSGGRLLVGDVGAVLAASKSMGEMPRSFLVHWLTEVGKNPRATRPISGPKVVAAIVREAFGAWVRSGGKKSAAAARPAATGKKGGASSFAESVRREAARRLQKRGRL